MHREAVRLGITVGPFEGCLGAERIRAFADATDDPSDRVRAAQVVPPVALVTQVWEAQNESRAVLVPEEFQRAAKGGVHGEHDLVLHRAIEPGEPLSTAVEGFGARAKGANAAVTLRYTTRDVRGIPVAEQLWTTVWLGVSPHDVGAAPPAHPVPEGATAHPCGRWEVEVDPTMARRYAEVSGDWSAHHFDGDAARRSGAARPFLHGLCALALCAQGVTELVAAGDPARMARIAVRFAKPLLLGERLVVDLYDAGPAGFAFEAMAGGSAVITNGRAEIR
jgi:acyl dehydratase